MVISTFSKVVLRCASCGKASYHDLSIFSFSRPCSINFECVCGMPIASLGTKDRKHYYFQVECGFCEDRHLYYYHWKELWDCEILGLVCEESNMDIAYVGPENKVEQVIENGDKSLSEMAEDLGFGDYFNNPDVMYGVLDCLYQLAESAALFCQCGNYNVEIEIYPDRLELKCDLCNCSGIVMAQNEVDLDAVLSFSEIELTDKGFKCLEGKNIKTNSRYKE